MRPEWTGKAGGRLARAARCAIGARKAFSGAKVRRYVGQGDFGDCSRSRDGAPGATVGLRQKRHSRIGESARERRRRDPVDRRYRRSRCARTGLAVTDVSRGHRLSRKSWTAGSRRCIRKSMAGCWRSATIRPSRGDGSARHRRRSICSSSISILSNRSPRRGSDYATTVENIDIGGPAMIRAAAKNHGYRRHRLRSGRLCGDPQGDAGERRRRAAGAPPAAGRQGLCPHRRLRRGDLATGLPKRSSSSDAAPLRAFGGRLAQP